MNTTSLLSTLAFGVGFGILAVSVYAALSSGLLSLASVSFAACGGFLFARCTDVWGVGQPVALLVSVVTGALIAAAVGVLLLHLESHYIAMATIAVVLMTRVAVLNLPDLTGGVNGTAVFTQLSGWTIIACLVAVMWVFARLRRSRYGLAAEIAREDTVVAATLGIRVRAVRTTSFMISGAVGGLAGAVLASLYGFLDADTFFMDIAFVALAAVVLGGAYHWLGALVGGVVFTMIPELLRGLFDRADQLLNGVILIAIMVFLPRGLIDPMRWRNLRLRRGRSGSTDIPLRASAPGGDDAS